MEARRKPLLQIYYSWANQIIVKKKIGLWHRILFFLVHENKAQTDHADLLQLAESNYRKKKYAEALENYNQLIKEGTTDGNIYFKRGLVKFALKMDEEAIKDYDVA